MVPNFSVTTDPLLVEGDSLVKTRFEGHKVYPDGLEANCAGDEAARGDPAPMRSWLTCRCIEQLDSSVSRTVRCPRRPMVCVNCCLL
jgi:hypothetical protein